MRRDEALERLARASWRAQAQPFFACLGGGAGATRAVGGIVRDTLLGIERSGTDIDLATRLLPEEVMDRAERAGIKAVPTGIDHGTVTLVHEGVKAEVTTLRADVETFGRRARVRFGTDWTEDARRRDFTMNALYCGMDGAIFDPIGGLSDCLSRIVRFIGAAAERIAEDRLRVFRYFRFAASHGRQVFDAEALGACRDAAGTLQTVSPERVGAEMMRLLGLPRCAATLRAMRAAGVLDWPCFDEEVLAALERLEAIAGDREAVERLAVPLVMGRRVEALRSDWRLSNADYDAVIACAGAARLAEQEKWAELVYRQREGAEAGIAVAAAVFEKPEAWAREALAMGEGIAVIPFPLSGDDLVGIGYKPGPALGRELRRLERLWIEAGFGYDREGLLGQARAPE